tara:strand:+ start:867 stop:1502 length:636 start_codon:yes stop_codon:yes gene_type:complete
MAAGDTFNRVRGWIGTLFALDIDGPQVGRNAAEERIKILDSGQTATTAAVDGTANAAYANMAGADPVALQDFVTQNFGDAAYAAIDDAVSFTSRTIEVVYQTVGSGGLDANVGATKDSTATIPAGARIDMVKVDVIVAFDGTTPTLTVGGTTTADLYQATGDNSITLIGTYEAGQYTDSPAGVEEVRVVVSSATGTVGHARVLVTYSTPTV